jgi:hypothetical protein
VRYDKNFIIDVLEQLDRAAGGRVMHVIVIPRDEPLFDFGSFGQCPDCGVPGLPHGQIADWRVAGRGDTGLHGHVFHDRVEFHLDLKNACKHPVQHALADTAVLPGAVIGGVVTAALVAILGGKDKDIATGFGVGATSGGLVGLGIPSRTARKVAFRDLLRGNTSRITNGGHHGWST